MRPVDLGLEPKMVTDVLTGRNLLLVHYLLLLLLPLQLLLLVQIACCIPLGATNPCVIICILLFGL